MILRTEVVARIHLAMWFIGLWNWFGGRTWKSWERKASGVLESSKQSLVSHSGGSVEDQNVKRNAGSKGQAHEVSRGNKDSVGSRTTYWSFMLHSGKEKIWPCSAHVLKVWIS